MSRPSRGYLTRHLLKSLFRGRQTIAYPEGPLNLIDRYRGRVILDIDKCVGCALCARHCPCEALRVQRSGDGGVRVILYHDRCATCGLCQLNCHNGAIRLVADFVRGAFSRGDLCTEWHREGRIGKGADPGDKAWTG